MPVEKETMSKLIVTTSWDDGSKLDLKLAEILGRHGIKGTFYVPRNYLGNPLEKNDIVMLDKGHEVGSHTLSHMDLTKIALPEADVEIRNSKSYLEDLLGHEVVIFAYPKGRYNEDIKKLVKDCGFIVGRTCKHGGFNFPEDPYEWQITLHASNGSPLTSLSIWWRNDLSANSLLDWGRRAKLLFDLALAKGGVYHLWGHSWELEGKNEWQKLEMVLAYISHRDGVRYMTNGEIFKLRSWQEGRDE